MEQNSVSSTKTKNRPRRNRYAAPIGGVYILLAVIGLIAVIIACINLTGNLLDNSGQLAEFEAMLAPVLMFDPVPFDSTEDADPIFLLQSSLWSTLYSDKRESYIYDDTGLMIVPASDVDVAGARLFGPDVALKHQTFGDFQSSYFYDEVDGVYRVPLVAQVGYYTPKVEKITKQGDLLELRVGYMASGSSWMTDTTGQRYEPTPDKYMTYVVRKNRNDYYIVAIRDTAE